MNKLNGFLYGLLSSASFGLIPMFTIPAMQQGMQFESILLYRFAFATLALGVILLIDGQSFHVSCIDYTDHDAILPGKEIDLAIYGHSSGCGGSILSFSRR